MAVAGGIQNDYKLSTNKEGLTTLKAKVNDIDIDELSESLISVKKSKAKEYEDKIIINVDKKIPAIYELRTKLATLGTTLDKLSNGLVNYSGVSAADSPLNARKAVVRSGDAAITIKVDPIMNVTKNDISLSVTQKASVDQISGTQTFTSPATAVAFSGTLVMNDQVITITSGTSTLTSISADINALSSKTGVSASIIKKSETEYLLQIEGSELAQPIDFTGTTATSNDIKTGLGLPDTLNTVAEDATDQINGSIQFTSSTTALALAGTLSLNGEALTISVDMTLDDVRDAINAVTETTKVEATVEYDAETEKYYLQLTGQTAGESINHQGIVDTSADVTTGLGISGINTDVDNLLAKITINNSNGSTTDITRKTNVISDISDTYAGLTILINSVSTKDTVFGVDYDREASDTAIQTLIATYNDVVDLIAVHKKLDAEGKPTEDAILHDSEALKTAQMLLNQISGIFTLGGSADDYATLSEIGITLNGYDESTRTTIIDGKLHVNTDKLATALYGDSFDKLIRLFARYATTTNQDFILMDSPTDLTTDIVGKDINVTFRYVGVTDVDDSFTANFSIPQPKTPLGAKVAGQTVTLTYSVDESDTYSVVLKNANDGEILSGTGILNGNQITFDPDSIYGGLVININDTHPVVDTPIISTFTLPQLTATISVDGQDDELITNIQGNAILPSTDSIYAGMVLSYNDGTSPMVMDGAEKTTILKMSKGIAVDYKKMVKETVYEYNPKNTDEVPSPFDVILDAVKNQDAGYQKQIDNLTKEADSILQKFGPRLNDLYKASFKAQSISLMLEQQRAILFGNS